MKIQNQNLTNVQSIIDPQDNTNADESNFNSKTSTGVGSVQSKFENAQSLISVEKMIEVAGHKVREDQTMLNQNQAETLRILMERLRR
jgi:hypothetical protein